MATAKTGSNTRIALKVGGTFGTPATIAAGDKLEVDSYDAVANTEELADNPIGSGNDMQNSADAGATSPSVTLTKTARYDDAATAAEAVFFGACSVSSGASAFAVSLLYDAARNSKFCTVVSDLHSTSILEIASATPTRLSYRAENPPSYLKQTIDMIGNNYVTNADSQTNTTSTLAAATVADATKIIVKPADSFWINARTGDALDSDDKISITSIEMVYEIPAEHVREIKGAAGNAQPTLSGSPVFMATVTVTFKELIDTKWFDAQRLGTEYKALFTVTDDKTALTGSIYRAAKFYFPCLKVIEDPQYPLNNPAINPHTVVFKALVTETHPTGMINGYPYIVYTSGQSTSYLA
jgi:DNA-binding transcriptional regulator YdaS (Cro superfamily)